MDVDPLDQAKRLLHIEDVYLVKAQAWLAEGFEPKLVDAGELIAQHKQVVAQATLGEVSDGDERLHYLFRVYLDLGMRLVPKAATEQPQEEHEPEVLACTEATFVAEYRCDQELDEEALRVFSQRNAGYHIWPFWREYLVSQCDRLRLPRVMVPTIRV
ncbi:MAG: preprotein translocase subunit SecB [Chloroflexia bacterium]|nr:preprotein translocase subunit SecB [Chloroflexia bacterium]